MKKLLFLLLVFVVPVLAQNPTLVTGTITDPNGVAWYPGTVTATLSPATVINPTVNGRLINTTSDNTQMRVMTSTNPDGSFSMSLFPNAAITPGGTQWVFFVYTNGSGQPAGLGPKNFTVAITIAGASQDVGPTLRASAPLLLGASGSVSGTVNQIGVTSGVASLAPNIILPGTIAASNAGVFTGTQRNEYMQSLLNSCDPGAEFFANHGYYPTDALAGCGAMPVGGSNEVHGVAGYANTLSSTAVGGSFQCRPLANNTFCDGSNSVVQDVAGLTTGVTLIGNDVNVYALNPPSAYTAVGGFNTALYAPNAGFYGPAFLAIQFTGGVGVWSQGMYIANGAAATGIVLGAIGASGTSLASQGIKQNYFDSGGVGHQVITETVNPSGTQYSTANNFAVQESSSCVGVGGFDLLCPDSTAHQWKMNNNNGTTTIVTGTVANGIANLGTSAIASGACATVVTVAGTGIATTDNIHADFNADPTGTTGYAPSANGMLTIIKYPTSGNVNFKICNNTGSSVTPGAITLNWRVVR